MILYTPPHIFILKIIMMMEPFAFVPQPAALDVQERCIIVMRGECIAIKATKTVNGMI